MHFLSDSCSLPIVSDGDLYTIFAALEHARVRYLVVGGVAVVLHGHPRFTADLDLVLHLEAENIRRAMEVLGKLGYRPRAPVPAESFADKASRRSWIETKGLTVFSLWSPSHPLTAVDIFVEEPFPFEEAYSRSLRADLGDISVQVVSLEDLIALKRAAGRPKDLQDIEVLKSL